MKMQYTEEQIAKANQTDLVSFLNAQGEQLVKSGKEYRWKKHDSVTVSGNRWYRHSQGRGGYPVDFVMEFYNATFPEAVKMLTGEEGEGRNSTCPAPSPDFRLPAKEENNDRIIRYLTENRGIEKNLVEEWIGSGNIYEEKKHHNVVFVGRDADGIPRYAHCKGTSETKYRGDVAGSDKSYGFSHRGTDNQLFVFEAAIDLLSFIQLFPKDWKKRSYLSLGGISSAALMAFLSERPQITSVFLCLDNDQAGNEACEKLAEKIPDGYSAIRLKPSKKDWNEILCDKNADRKKAIIETVTMKVPEKEELVPMLCYEDIEQTSVEWPWFPYLPFGILTIILSYVVNLVNEPFMILFFLVYAAFGCILTLISFFSRLYMRKMRISWKDVLKAILLSGFELIGLRFILMIVRMNALIGYRKYKDTWGTLERKKLNRE